MYYGFQPYVPVAKKLAKANSFAQKVAKKEGRQLSPARCNGRQLGKTFWGKAWCENLYRYAQIANRLDRGKTYLGNGSVVDLQIKAGLIQAIVAGSEVYEVEIKIKTLSSKTWQSLKKDCARSIHSLLDLLQGKFDDDVMKRMAQADGGLFPKPAEIEMNCSCPDGAAVCKHLAAVVYGVSVRLDDSPELLFALRNVDHSELITQAVASENLEQSLASSTSDLAGSDLGELFGIELDVSSEPIPATGSQTKTSPSAKKVVAKSKSNSNKAKVTSPAVVATAPAKKPTARKTAKSPANRKAK
jgi:uncharacterized Zn finger protein